MGNTENKQQKQKDKQNNKYTKCFYDGISAFGINGNQSYDATLSDKPWVADRITVCETGRTECVYDIINCGQRHQFVVWDSEAGRCRIVSNCVQAISRDILCFAMKNLKDYSIVMHVHDEVVIEAEMDTSIEEICNKMGVTPPWAKGLLLRAEGYETAFYKKD